MNKNLNAIQSDEVTNVYALGVLCDNAVGTQSEVRIVLPDGTIVSYATVKVLTLSDNSEVFEVHVK